MAVGGLRVAGHGHAAAEEGDVPQVGEGHGGAGVDAEDLHAGEGGDDADEEAEHVGDGGDGDGDAGLLVGGGHALLDARLDLGAAPRAEHDEGVVDADACKGSIEKRV